jgi:hypothetical protein
MRKMRRNESGLLYEIPRDVLKLIGFRIVATKHRVKWDDALTPKRVRTEL